MPLTLRILSFRNQSVPGAAWAQFSGQGGTLGRAPGNALVLDDPGKYISRVHARVTERDGAYYLEDLGSNPSIVNDRPLGKGSEVALAHGDRVVIGDYLLQAVVETLPAMPQLAPAPVNDPTLPLFEPPPQPRLPPAPLPVAAARPGPGPEVPATPVLDPLHDPLRDPLAGASILDVAPGQPGGGDPLGLNLFAPPPGAPARAAQSDHVSPELAALPPGALPAARPAPAAPAAPAFVPGAFAIPHDYDPLADFLPAAAPAAPMQASPALAPTVAPAAVPAREPEPPPPAEAASAATPAARVGPEITAMYRPEAGQQPAAPAVSAPVAVPSAAATPIPPVSRLAAAATPAPADAPVPPPAPGHASDDAVLQALLRGLGLPDLQLQRPATEVAETVGAMLRIATEGTIDVLMARALTKKESRIDMTMLSVRANNPLKFFPHAEGALTQMLTGALSGYLGPREAMAGAFDDLRAHELAVIAGMRAALGAVLERFDPARIEARLAVPSVMDKVLGANRKAKLWDRLVELYGEIAREADDDLQRLYGEKFSEAYEAQVARLRAARE